MARATAPIIMILLLTALSGCEPQFRHRMLTFFFTGVPPLDDREGGEELKDQPTSPAKHQPAVALSDEKLFSHPLWLAGVCNPCHQTTSTFRIPGIRNKSVLAFKTGGGMVGKLTLPENRLCTQCHTDKIPQRALAENLWLHNTTAKGDCLACHDPHQSGIPKTLRQPPALICTSPCHDKGKFTLTPVHQTTDPCLSCHNPHMGINKNLLTKEYKEIKQPVAPPPGHPELGGDHSLP